MITLDQDTMVQLAKGVWIAPFAVWTFICTILDIICWIAFAIYKNDRNDLPAFGFIFAAITIGIFWILTMASTCSHQKWTD